MQADWALSVSQLNEYARRLLAGDPVLRALRVRGEITGFKRHYSGHMYFSIKDEAARVQCVMFRQNAQALDFEPADGQMVVIEGGASLYAATGTYQIYCQSMWRAGAGALYLKFEALKKKLAEEGLFDPSLKKPLPLLPARVGIVTSPTGAAIRDMIRILRRRNPAVGILIAPCQVQGDGAAADIARALDALNRRGGVDVILCGRGGGSIEDLWAFNEEVAARALASCPIPTISAVGHEIDYTISDFVADFRAPTPTAGAEWVLHRMEEFRRELAHGADRMVEILRRKIEGSRQAVEVLEKRMVSPRRRLEDWKQFLDDRLERMQLALARRMERQRTSLDHLVGRLRSRHPSTTVEQSRIELNRLQREMAFQLSRNLETWKYRLQENASKLDSLSPLAVLKRGYAIGYRLENMAVLRNSGQVRPGDEVGLRLFQGALKCTVLGEWDPTKPSLEG